MLSNSELKGGFMGSRRLLPVPSMNDEMVKAPRTTTFLFSKPGV
jgi:hypothetical protein